MELLSVIIQKICVEIWGWRVGDIIQNVMAFGGEGS
jgi:hypothetical protein